jgi:hypothetical protein
VQNFGSVLTNAVAIKGITVYLRKSCSHLALKMMVNIDSRRQFHEIYGAKFTHVCKLHHFVILSNNFLHALKESRLKKSE